MKTIISVFKLKNKEIISELSATMGGEKTKDVLIPTAEMSRKTLSSERIPHRGRKRSYSATLGLTKSGVHQQSSSREEVEANRLLTKAPHQQKLSSSTRHSETSRLLNMIPDLNQKELSRVVGAILKRQKREGTQTGPRVSTAREKNNASALPPLFPEKSMTSTLSNAELNILRHPAVQKHTGNQQRGEEMSARSAALTKHEALQLLQKSGTSSRPTSGTAELSRHEDLAEELVRHASTRYCFCQSKNLLCQNFIYCKGLS